MIWIILIIIALIAVLVFLFSFGSNNDDGSNNNSHYTSGYTIWLEKRKGFTKYQMVGMYYRGLKKSDMGKFEGCAKAKKYNLHDSFAVAIYNNVGKHVGYLPAGNKYIHELILENNGSLPAYGYISCDNGGYSYTGEVAIKTNTALDTRNPFYNKKIAIVGRFDISQKELANALNNLGAYICSSVHENTDIILIGENIKSTQMVDKFELLRKNGCNIKAIYKDEVNKILEACK